MLNETLRTQFDNLWGELVPWSGKCESQAGELIRAAGRLQHDFYNNGMGNNTSGAVNLLREKGVIDKTTHEEIYYYSRGRVVGYGSCLEPHIDRAVEQTVEFVLNNPILMSLENTEDMFDYSDDEQQFCEECDTDLEGCASGWGHICLDCYNAMEEEEEY